MPRPTSFSDEWEKYRSMVLSRAGEIQTQETKRAFYAGAAMLLVVLRAGLSEGPETTPADHKLAEDIHEEVFSFLESMIPPAEYKA